jgi:hypothetical protein
MLTKAKMLNLSKQALVFSSEPIDLAAMLSPAPHAGASLSKAGKAEYIA